MNSALRQRTGNVAGLRQHGFRKQSLPQCVYLLEKSLDRYEYFKKSGAPDILADVETVLIRGRLLSVRAGTDEEKPMGYATPCLKGLGVSHEEACPTLLERVADFSLFYSPRI